MYSKQLSAYFLLAAIFMVSNTANAKRVFGSMGLATKPSITAKTSPLERPGTAASTTSKSSGIERQGPPNGRRVMMGLSHMGFQERPGGNDFRPDDASPGAQFPCAVPTKRACCKSLGPMTGEFMMSMLANGIKIADILPYSKGGPVGMKCTAKIGDPCEGGQNVCCKIIHKKVGAGLSCVKF